MWEIDFYPVWVFGRAVFSPGIANGGFQKGDFKWLNVLRFLRVEIGCCKGFLLKIDTSPAIATTGLRTNLLFENPPFRKPPI